jgi:hypothetical protein
LSGWFQIQKRIQNLFENGFGKLEKRKRERNPILFGFLAQLSPCPLLPHAARSPSFSLRAAVSFSLRSAWAEPSKPPLA